MSPRRITRRLLACTATVLLFFGIARAADDPASFIADLGKRAVDVLTSHLAEPQRDAQFRALFEEGFDVPAIARFVLGPYWRTATDSQRQEFTNLFEAYIVHAYTVRFSQYNNQQFKIQATRPENSTTSLVVSQITQPDNKPPVNVDWRVAKIGSGYKIEDVLVEGISMAVTERQEIASVIQRNGGQIDALLKLLREKSGRG